MGTHLIPREVTGEARILIIFTQKGFIYTLVGIGVGALLHTFLSGIGLEILGWCVLVFFALVAFILGQVKIPDTNSNALMKKIGGDYIDDVLIKYFKFIKSKKIYTYDKGGEKK